MRLFLLLVTAISTSALLSAQDAAPSSSSSLEAAASSQEDAAPAEMPVSLDRIREGLSRPPPDRLLENLKRPPDFTVQVEARKLEEIFEGLDFKTGPTPAGGLYAYEQQRRLFRPIERPLMQPYAAFSANELLTIAIQNLAVKYLGGRMLEAVTDWERERAEAAARAEVARAIAEYCAVRPDRYMLTICASQPAVR